MTDIVERLRADSYALPSDGEWLDRDGSTIPNNVCSQAADEIKRLRAERDALRADAERYRWLRDKAGQQTAYDIYKDGGMWSIAFFSADHHLPFDAAIDAAMAS